MNNCSFIGRLGKDPELKHTNGGKAVTNFSIAINRDGKKDESDWIDFIAWEKTAEIITKYCRKGDLIGVTGSLQQKVWTDKDGNKRSSHEVKVNRIDFCGGKKNDDIESLPARAAEPVEIFMDEGELPF